MLLNRRNGLRVSACVWNVMTERGVSDSGGDCTGQHGDGPDVSLDSFLSLSHKDSLPHI